MTSANVLGWINHYLYHGMLEKIVFLCLNICSSLLSISLLSAFYDFGLTGGGTVNIGAGSVSLLIKLILIVIGIISLFMRSNKDTGSSSSIPNLREKSLLVVVIILIIDAIIVSVSIGVIGSVNRNLVYNEVCRYKDEMIEFLERAGKEDAKVSEEEKVPMET